MLDDDRKSHEEQSRRMVTKNVQLPGMGSLLRQQKGLGAASLTVTSIASAPSCVHSSSIFKDLRSRTNIFLNVLLRAAVSRLLACDEHVARRVALVVS